MLEHILIGTACFCIGLFAGDRLRKIRWGMLDWVVMKWSPDSFGYRISPATSKVKRGEKVFIALKIDTTSLPDEGLQLFEEEN